jgi:hypothetical protein
MAAKRSKSKKPSAGSEHSPPQPEEFVLFLDENLCNSAAILETLNKLGIRFERHLDRFSRGAPDEEWLPVVGANGWILLTSDKKIRYNFLEKRALLKSRVREFVFVSGNMSGAEMAGALEMAFAKMQRMCRKFQPPFVAALTRAGEVHLRWPRPEQKRN